MKPSKQSHHRTKTPSKKDATQAQAEHPNPPVPPTVSGPKVPRADDDDSGSHQGKHWIDYATFCVGVAGTLGLIVYCFITYGLYRENQKAANATKIAADAAEEQTSLLRQQMEGVYGAAMYSSMQLDYDNGLVFSFYNTGLVKSPKVVLDLRVYKQPFPYENPGGQPLIHYVHDFFQIPANAPNTQPTPTLAHIMEISKDEEAALDHVKPERNVVVKGYLSYDTGFGRIVKEDVCFVHFYFPAYDTRYGQKIPPEASMVPCSDFDRSLHRAQRGMDESKK